MSPLRRLIVIGLAGCGLLLDAVVSAQAGEKSASSIPTPITTATAVPHRLTAADVAKVFPWQKCPKCCHWSPSSDWVTYGDRREFLVTNRVSTELMPDATIADLHALWRLLKRMGLKGANCSKYPGISIMIPKSINVISLSEKINALKVFRAKPSPGPDPGSVFNQEK